MMIIQNVLAFVVTLGVLVSIHEYGHFWVARRCGVKVLRFSIGFGKPLYTRKDKLGTEFVIAAFPLGGYVKMLDEREGEIAEADLPYAFNRQPVGERMAIAAAGPVANFLFAIVAYWSMFLLGTQVVIPVIGGVNPESVATQAGLKQDVEILAVDGVETPSWSDVSFQLLRRLGDSGDIAIRTKPLQGGTESTVYLPVSEWLVGKVEPDPLESLGIEPFRPKVLPVINEVSAGGRALEAGLKTGDLILSVNDVTVEDWSTFVSLVQAKPEEALRILVKRNDVEVALQITPASREMDEKMIGYIGAGVLPPEYPEQLMRTVQYGPFDSVGQAVNKTWEMRIWTFVYFSYFVLLFFLSPKMKTKPVPERLSH